MESIRRAVEESDIRSIHPDKMEEWAEHLVRKLKNEFSYIPLYGLH